MRQLILKMSVSVDGFVGGPHGEIDWIFKTMDQSATAWTVDNIWQAGVHIMGSRTFHDMAAYWPSSTEPFAAPMNEIPKVVFSSRGIIDRARSGSTTQALRDATKNAEGSQLSPETLANEASWINATVAGGDLATEIARLKDRPGKDIFAHGGAGFAQSLSKLNLVDEYRLLVHPVALGAGLPLFPPLQAPIYLRLVRVTTFDSGAAAHIYRPV